MKEKLEKAIKGRSRECGKAERADDALKYTQAALNAAHALIAGVQH